MPTPLQTTECFIWGGISLTPSLHERAWIFFEIQKTPSAYDIKKKSLYVECEGGYVFYWFKCSLLEQKRQAIPNFIFLPLRE